MFSFVVPTQVDGLHWWPLALVIVLLVVMNIINNRVAPQTHYMLWAFGGSLVMLAVGLLDGLSWTDLGLGWSYQLIGLIWAGICIGLVTLGYLIAASIPKTRDAFHDERISDLSPGRLVFQSLIEVPFGTVLFEEIAFRSVLFAMLAQRYGWVWAVVWSSLIFGLWHILPSIGTHEQSAALGSVVGEGTKGNILAIVVSVLTTTVAGVLFAGLRIVSGSVLAPMGLHWATNGLGYAFSWFIIRWRTRSASRSDSE